MTYKKIINNPVTGKTTTEEAKELLFQATKEARE